MKCPYRNFEKCIVQECPACNYRAVEKEVIDGKKPYYMSDEDAMNLGCLWKSKRTTYEFISCKLIENGTQPIPAKKEIVNNTTKTSIVVKNSIF